VQAHQVHPSPKSSVGIIRGTHRRNGEWVGENGLQAVHVKRKLCTPLASLLTWEDSTLVQYPGLSTEGCSLATHRCQASVKSH
jgi:hypothetical protein